MLFAFIMEIVISALSLMPVIGQLIATLGGLALMWLNIVVSIRRLHDLDKSGWLLLLPGVPYILFFLSLILAVLIYDSYLFLVMCYACVVAAIGFSIYLLVLTITKGTTGPNRFGPDPLGFEYHEGSFSNQGPWQGQGNWQNQNNWQGQGSQSQPADPYAFNGQQGNWNHNQGPWQNQGAQGQPGTWNPSQSSASENPFNAAQFDPREGFSASHGYGQSSDPTQYSNDANFSDDQSQPRR